MVYSSHIRKGFLIRGIDFGNPEVTQDEIAMFHVAAPHASPHFLIIGFANLANASNLNADFSAVHPILWKFPLRWYLFALQSRGSSSKCSCRFDVSLEPNHLP